MECCEIHCGLLISEESSNNCLNQGGCGVKLIFSQKKQIPKMVYNYTKPRGPIAAMYSSPGPCYALPGLVGQRQHDPRSDHHKGAEYSFGIRYGKWTDNCSPGPCYYPDSKVYRDGRDGTPHYSLYGRQRDVKSFRAPGPGAYTPEKAGPSSKPMPPAYSFGIRHRHRRTDDSPGECRRY